MRSSLRWYNKLTRMLLQKGLDHKELCGELSGLVRTERPQISVIFVEPLLPHPMVTYGDMKLSINGNPLTHIYGIPMNWKLPLMEISPIMRLRRPFLLNYSVIKDLIVPYGISMRDVGCTSRQIPSILWHHNF